LKPKVIVILGQTATGKSALAVKIAKKFNGEIISADSRQVYKGLDIGTGKITKKEMQGIPHHLLNVINPKKKFTVVEYQKLATSAMADICKRGKTPIICGGTGFYIDAITKGIVFPEVPANFKLRNILLQKPTTVLFRMMQKIDPERARNIDSKNKVRLIRAIEIAKHFGEVPHLEARPPSYEFIKIGLSLPLPNLKEKIGKRVKKMFYPSVGAGLLKEIAKLGKLGVSKKRLKEFGFEYNEPTIEKVVSGSVKYAKRQMTWFKRDKEIKWFVPSDYIKIEKYLKNKINF
jgi:tRNA dimethylallyltransferase